MHQRGIGWTCLHRHPWQTPTGSSDPQRRTRGTRLRRPRCRARSLRQLKNATTATGKQAQINIHINSNEL